MSWFCYIIRCSDGSFYTGITKNLKKRLRDHQRGRGARHTSKYRPVEVLWFENFIDMKSAMRREKEIKGWRREKKLKLVTEFRKSPSG